MNKTHITTQGDTWDYLAYKYYGNEYLIGSLIEANSNYANINILPAGVQIIIPPINDKNIKKLEPIW